MHNLAEQFKDPKNQLIHKDSVRMSTDKVFREKYEIITITKLNFL